MKLRPNRSKTRIVFVKSPLIHVLVLCSLCLAANARSALASSDTPAVRVRRIILHSRHLGAHGMGYNSQSLTELSQELTPADVPIVLDLVADRDLSVGVEFALASQCGASIMPVREAAVQHKMDFLDASDTMYLMSDFDGCPPETRQRAIAMRAELDELRQEDQRKMQQEAKRQADEDARIQRNALKIMDPKQAKDLTRQEREEVFRRSLKAMGLREDGPMTAAQKKLVDRMYRTMVLGEPSPSSHQ